MHLVPEQQRRGPKHRSLLERAFRNLNVLIIAAHFGCVLVMLSQIATAASKTFDSDFWFSSTLRLSTIIDEKTQNCTQTRTMGVSGFSPFEQDISDLDQLFRFAEFASDVRFCIGINIVLLIVSGVNKLCFDINLFRIRWRHLRIRKDLVTTLEFVCIVIAYVSVAGLETNAATLRSYLRYCGVAADTSLPFIAPLVAMYVGLSITTFFHLVTTAIMVARSLKKRPTDEPQPSHLRGPYAKDLPELHSLTKLQPGEYIGPLPH